jgi:K+-transporting ATPase KdpF subunit
MTLLYVAGTVLSAGLLIYLFAALLVPEKLQ